MIETVFRSADLPVAERFASWYDMACHCSHVASVIRSDHEADFRATVHLLDLGAVRLSRLTYPSLQTWRTPRQIRQFDPEAYCLSLTSRGSMRLAQAGRETVAGPHDFMLYDTSRPFQGRAEADGHDVEGMVLQFPRRLLPLPAGKLTRLMVRRLPARDGVGALLRRYLIELTRHGARYSAADITRLTTIALDLLAAVYAHHLEADAALPPETHRRALQVRIHDFIRCHLGNPDLSPETIAAAHQISVRHLQKLFQEQGLTVATWIRHRRLEQCRRVLADPRQRSRPVHAVAARWGFTDAAHFSRLFRGTYGISPTEYRHLIAAGEAMGHPLRR